MADYMQFWGKARPGINDDATWHPAACHCLDVAAVCGELLDRYPVLAADLASSTGWKARDWMQVVVFLVALHDIGKFSRAFQSMLPDLWPACLGSFSDISPGRHDAVGLDLLMNDRLLDVVAPLLEGWADDDVRLIFGAIAGHHGCPIKLDQASRSSSVLGAVSIAAASAFASDLVSLLAPPPLTRPPKRWASKASWWLAGRADELLVALPTMPTADAMFAQVAKSYRRLFSSQSRPSLALAHGRAKLNDLFKGSILPGAKLTTDIDDAAGATATTQCATWLSEERRRAFLAHVGVGTIDQALLGVLPARHATLRQFGLARKVLVIDEAHSFDPYVSAELDTLLRFHAMQGGHSVFLSP